MIVSVSRRSDIPRFAFDWFLEKLDAGFVEVPNPFNFHQKRRVSLLPSIHEPVQDKNPVENQEDRAELFAFWTRDPASILEHADELGERGYRFYVMITLNAYPEILEPNCPSSGTVIQTMRMLADKIGADRVIWRYDPVFLSDKTDYEFHQKNFAALAASLNGVTRRVIVSVYDEYAASERRLLKLEQSGVLKPFAHYESNDGSRGKKRLTLQIRQLLAGLSSAARAGGMDIQSCAEEDLSDLGIRSGACIDGEYILKIFHLKVPEKDSGQKRPYCLCAQSVDIGTYGRCAAGCVYCYGLRS